VGAIALVIGSALVIELFWRSSLDYIADLRFALEVSGAVRGTWGQITDHVLGNLADYVLFSLIVFVAMQRTRSLRDGLFYTGCAVGGFFLINQNFQAWGIITLHAAAAVAAETILRQTDDAAVSPELERWSAASGAKLLFIAFVLPTIAHCTIALGLHAAAAGIRAGDAIPFPNLDGIRLANLWTWPDHSAGLEYLTAVRDGAALAIFSGDKLLGGPQAGIAVGASRLVSAMRRHPLARALRADKLCLAALEATLNSYLDGTASEELPTLGMLHAPASWVEERAEELARRLSGAVPGLTVDVAASVARSGGGTLPTFEIPSFAVRLGGMEAEALAERLRSSDPPVVGRVREGRLWLDARTLLPGDEEAIVAAVGDAFA
jgi:hypothetical protein